MNDQTFDAGLFAYLLHAALFLESDSIRLNCLTSAVTYQNLIHAAARVLQHGEHTMQPYWKKAFQAHSQDGTKQNVSLYACLVACMDTYGYLQYDIAAYNKYGGGALRVLCKRSLTCYYASIFMIHYKLQQENI